MIAVILALAGVFLIAPGGASVFGGLPIDGLAEFISAAGLFVLAVSRTTRVAFAAAPRFLRRALVALLLAGLLAKSLVLARGRYDGFAGCYAGVVPAVTSCTPSYDNPFRRQGATRIDALLRFDQGTWRLGLLNKREYDFARDNSPAVMGLPPMELIDHPRRGAHFDPPVPFAARWRSTMTASRPATITVQYIGEGTVEVDGAVTPLGAHFADAPATTSIAVPAGAHQLTITYRWAPPVDVSVPVPKKARLRLDAPDIVRFGDATSLDRWLGAAADVIGGAAFVLLFAAALGWTWQAAGTLAVPLAIALVMVALPLPAWWRDKLLELTMIGVCLQWMLKRSPILPFVLILATLGAVRVGWAAGPAPGVVHYRSWGDDGLSYDSFAREIFEKGTLRAGEDSFRGQALFRYVRFVERVLMGEDEWLIIVCALVLFYLSYSWLGRRALDLAPGHLLVIVTTTAVLLWITGGLIAFVDSALTEYSAWILLPVSTGLLLLGRSTREHLLAVVLIGAGVLLRFNHLPAWVILLTFFALRPAAAGMSRAQVAVALALFGAVVCVPMLAHNLYYGHEWRILPDSAAINTDFPVARWTVSTLLDRGRYLLHVGTDAPTAYLPLHALQLVLVGVAAAVFTGRWRVNRWHGWLFLAPLAALSVHLVLNVNVYYPRHILFAYLLAGAIVLVLAAEDGVRRAQGAGAR